ncbi:hypothetical protein Salat_2882000 [Sesamum alatum]|uniref:Uncharacterized protein n=1 Tax=Sesamum alatum TaxID=300844 RepID=A0AAE1XMM9_9LAMI|nr:hypothetical protein Salat_2882000 [Sesamum alatum]
MLSAPEPLDQAASTFSIQDGEKSSIQLDASCFLKLAARLDRASRRLQPAQFLPPEDQTIGGENPPVVEDTIRIWWKFNLNGGSQALQGFRVPLSVKKLPSLTIPLNQWRSWTSDCRRIAH